MYRDWFLELETVTKIGQRDFTQLGGIFAAESQKMGLSATIFDLCGAA